MENLESQYFFNIDTEKTSSV